MEGEKGEGREGGRGGKRKAHKDDFVFKPK
jgi:hypothetical protein